MKNLIKELWKPTVFLVIYWTITILLSINNFFSYKNIKIIVIMEIILIVVIAIIDYSVLYVDVLFCSSRKAYFTFIGFIIGWTVYMLECTNNIIVCSKGIAFMLVIPVFSGITLSRIIQSIEP